MSTLLKKLRCFYHPERFQGWGKKKQYFEGWYFKVVDPTLNMAYAFIPGISMEKDGSKHAFIQVLNGVEKTSTYHRFPFEAFNAEHRKLAVTIGENFFDEGGMRLALPGLSADVNFSSLRSWPVSLLSPGIMGPYAFVPRMECYHGIVSMDHRADGWMEVDEWRLELSEGRGYIEQDWGHSFPSAYFWMQSNHFSEPGTSFKCSVATIPWMGSSFVGFIAGLLYDDKLIQFTTYNGSKLIHSYADI
ncbi:MAG: tocopherol cyclase family protein, partial [Saprospiraceae bacterium]|nr:tocopherol cyclase family protein [Saprospiraceae bacterium]